MAVIGIIMMVVMLVVGLAELVATIFILINAFQKSVGTGFMVLCIPCYLLYYLHTEYDGDNKELWMGILYGGIALNVVLRLVAAMLSQ
jgi:uncharacterized membrane protein YphA (DoxX/SURF4 family)